MRVGVGDRVKGRGGMGCKMRVGVEGRVRVRARVWFVDVLLILC